MKLAKERKIELCASKDVTRPHMCAPYYDAKAKRLVATDGHKMAVLAVEADDSDHEGYVPVDVLKAARKLTKKGEDIQIALGVDKITTLDGVAFPRNSTDEKFVPYQKVVPDESTYKDQPKIAFNARLLWEIAQALGTEQVRIQINGELDPIRVTVADGSNDGESVAILMPVRY